MDLLFNALLLAVDLLVVGVVARSRRTAVRLLAVAAGLFAALLAAGVLHHSFFQLARFYAYVAFGHVPLVLAGIGCVLWRRSRRLSVLALVAAILVWGAAADAFLVEPYRLEVSTVRLASPKVAHPLRVTVVSDFQADRIRDYERRALRTALDTHPDLIVMPGDYLHEKVDARRRILAAQFERLLAELDFGAPLGAYAVGGNTDYAEWPELFAGSRVTPLPRTTTLEVDGIELTGLSMEDSFDASLRIEASDRFRIVFGHGPDFALGRVDADLLIAGHTHGGQVRLPLLGPLITFSHIPRAWAAGVTPLPGNRTLVVSRGIGMERGEAPRLRFLCRPQIVVIDVVPAP